MNRDNRTQKRRIGDLGESIVCRYLRTKGYSVIERNYLKPWGEIDIVAKNGSIISFIEVKSVTREPFASVSRENIRPEENMHPAKMARLQRAAQTFLLDHNIPDDTEWQIDLACVFLDISGRRAKVEMFNNVIL